MTARSRRISQQTSFVDPAATLVTLPGIVQSGSEVQILATTLVVSMAVRKVELVVGMMSTEKWSNSCKNWAETHLVTVCQHESKLLPVAMTRAATMVASET